MARKPKLDGIDADHIGRVLDSRGWQLIKQRIEKALAMRIDELQGDLDALKTAEVRGVIQGLKLALQIPNILKGEANTHGRSDT